MFKNIQKMKKQKQHREGFMEVGIVQELLVSQGFW
jgi:hypothetical protein